MKPKNRVDGSAFSPKFGDLITADHKLLNVENESRCGHKNAPTVRDDFTNWIQSYPMKTKETMDTLSFVFTKIYSSVTEAGKN